MLGNLTVPVLAANFVSKDTHEYPAHVQPYKIYEVDGVRVAVIGLANATPTKPVTRYEFLDPLKSIERVLPQVEAQNPALVVVIVEVPEKFLREFVSSTWGMFSYAGVGVGRYQDEGDQRVRININGIALDDTQVYQVAVPEFIANGNMEARLFAQISADKKKKVNGVRIRELMRKDLRTPKESFAYDMYNYPTIVDYDELANMIKKSYPQRGNSRL